MSTKQSIIQRIKEDVVKEELAIPLYTSHIQQTLFWSGLPEKSQKRIIAGLKTLQHDSQIHVKEFKAVLKRFEHESP